MGISVGYPHAPGVLSSAVMTGNVTLSSSPGAPTFHLLYSLYSHCEGAEVPAGDPCALCERTARERPEPLAVDAQVMQAKCYQPVSASGRIY